MNAQDLKNSILQLAIQGKLVEQREEEGTAKELLGDIKVKKKQLIKEGKIKNQKTLTEINDDEIPFDIPKSWEWVRLVEVGEIIGGGTPKTGREEFWNNGDIPWLTPADMRAIPGKHVNKGSRFITEEGLKNSSAKLMPKGTIIYSSRAPIGYVKIATNDLTTNQGFKSLVPYLTNISEYMYYCLIAKTSEIISRASGTTFKEISGKKFGLTTIPLPPLEEQKRIVAKIEELLPYVDKYDVAYSEVEELNKTFPEDMQKSILQYAVKGKLVEQREEDGTAEDLFNQIQEEKKKLIKEGKIKKTKDLPEITEEEKPFDIPEHWKWVKFGDIVDFNMGKTPPRSEGKYWKDDYPWVSIADMISNGHVSKTKEKISELALKDKFKMSTVPVGTLLMSFKLTIGKVSILDIEALHNEAIISIYPYADKDNTIRDYLFTMLPLLTVYGDTKGAIKGKTLNSTSIKNLLIPLPPISEQRSIIDKIDEIKPVIDSHINKH